MGLKFGGLKYYPLCGFDGGQFLNKRHVRKLEFGQGLHFWILGRRKQASPASPGIVFEIGQLVS